MTSDNEFDSASQGPTDGPSQKPSVPPMAPAEFLRMVATEQRDIAKTCDDPIEIAYRIAVANIIENLAKQAEREAWRATS